MVGATFRQIFLLRGGQDRFGFRISPVVLQHNRVPVDDTRAQRDPSIVMRISLSLLSKNLRSGS